VGKTVVGWEIHTALTRSGVRAGYVDADQLGICHPETAADPGRHRLQARNLAAVVAGHRAAGAECVVVSGVVDARHGVHVDELAQAALTVCRLRADRPHLTQRFIGRQGHADGLPRVLQEAADLDAGDVADVCVDTSGMTVSEAARQVRERVGGWPSTSSPSRGDSAPRPDPPEAVTDDAGTAVEGAHPVLWLCGVTGVGKSTVGFQLYLRTLTAGTPAAYLDLDQIDLRGPGPADHHLRAGTTAALWRNFRRAGARALVIVGPVPDADTVRLYADALAPAMLTVCRLHAGPEELADRILSRGRGGSWSSPGDPLMGQPAAHLLYVAGQASRDADALERTALGHRIDTDGRTAEQVVDTVRTKWSDLT
jgi:hypothetical protein